MHSIEQYKTELLMYILGIVIIALIVLMVINVVLLILKLTKVFNEKKVWILSNLVVTIILLFCISSASFDILTESYCEIDNVTKMEIIVSNGKEYILITDGEGTVYTCKSHLYDTKNIDELEFPGKVVYAKHSKLLLDYITK